MTGAALLAGAMTDGIALRTAINPDTTTIADPDDDTEWTLLGVGLAAIAHELLEDATDLKPQSA